MTENGKDGAAVQHGGEKQVPHGGFASVRNDIAHKVMCSKLLVMIGRGGGLRR